MQLMNHDCCVQILEAQNQVAEKTEIYVPYNILPLDPDSANQAIMRYPEVFLQLPCFFVVCAFPFTFMSHLCNYHLNHSGCHSYQQIQAAVYALGNTTGLPWPRDYKKKNDEDILDWLQAMFGFQVSSPTSSCNIIYKICYLSMTNNYLYS